MNDASGYAICLLCVLAPIVTTAITLREQHRTIRRYEGSDDTYMADFVRGQQRGSIAVEVILVLVAGAALVRLIWSLYGGQ